MAHNSKSRFDLQRLFERPDESPVFLVAEIGINHMGDENLAEQMIRAAVTAGADGVKLQAFSADTFLNPELLPEANELFKGFELSTSALERLRRIAESEGLVFFVTPLSADMLDYVIAEDYSLVKIASSDITTEPFLERIAESGIRTIMSTGFADNERIKRALRFFSGKPLILLYCISEYPPEPGSFDLNAIPAMRSAFRRPIGFSDHSIGIALSVASVALGACVIERHFTIDRSMKGADHAVSLGPDEFKELAHQAALVKQALGDGSKTISKAEKNASHASMRGIYSAGEIKKGERISEDSLLLLRPGDGVSMDDYRALIGNNADKDFRPYENL